MGQYHKYTEPPGDFEAVYANEDVEHYDAWMLSDRRPIQFKFVDMLINSRHFTSILDVGCGKGHQTHAWAIPGRRVVGYDISHTAINKARATYSDVDFRQGDGLEATRHGQFDLVVCSMSLYVQESWREVISQAAKCGRHIIVNEWIPEPTVWHIPSIGVLEAELRRWYTVESKIVFNDQRLIIMGISNESI